MSQRTVNQTAQVAPAVRLSRSRSLAGHVKAAVLPMSERIKSDGLVQPSSVAGITSTDDPSLPMSERIKSDGLVQPLRSPGSPARTTR